MHRSIQVQRILKEKKEFETNPSETVFAAPLEGQLHIWHFTIKGPPDTEFQDGIYHGRIDLPVEYPLKAPAIYFLTPSGRYEINTPICLTITSYHPETWNPAWTIRSMLHAIISYFPEKEKNPGIGALNYSREERKKLALLSRVYTCKQCGSTIKLLQNPKNETAELQKKSIIPAAKKEVVVEVATCQKQQQYQQPLLNQSRDKIVSNKLYTAGHTPVLLAEEQEELALRSEPLNISPEAYKEEQITNSSKASSALEHVELENSIYSVKTDPKTVEAGLYKASQQVNRSKSYNRKPLSWSQPKEVPPVLEYILRQYELYREAKKSVGFTPNILHFSPRKAHSAIYSLKTIITQTEDTLGGRSPTKRSSNRRSNSSGSTFPESNAINLSFSQSIQLLEPIQIETDSEEPITTQNQMLVDRVMLGGAFLLLGYTVFTRLFY